MTRINRVLVYLMVACASGCGKKSQVVSPARHLVGAMTDVWVATFRRTATDTALAARGVIALFPSAVMAEQLGGPTGTWSASGTYDVDFRPLGFNVAGGMKLRLATVTYRSDSVTIVLNATVGHGRLTADGVMLPDRRIAGEWSYDGPGGGRGTFTLKLVPLDER